MGDFNIHIGRCPSTIMNVDLDILNENGRESGPIDPFEGGGIVLQRSTVDILKFWDTSELPKDGVEFIDRMDNIGLVVLNGLDDIPDAKIAEATFGDLSSVIDYILIDSDHWECMKAVSVLTREAGVEISDHHIVTSSLSYIPQNRPIPRGPPPSDNISFLLSDVRFCTNSRGDKQFYEKYQAECADALGELCKKWTDQKERGDSEVSQVETVWSEFTESVEHMIEIVEWMKLRQESMSQLASIPPQ